MTQTYPTAGLQGKRVASPATLKERIGHLESVYLCLESHAIGFDGRLDMSPEGGILIAVRNGR